MYLRARDVDEAASIIANQGKLGGDIPIFLSDSTSIKGTVIEDSDANFSKLPTIVIADAVPLETLSVLMKRLNGFGDAFMTCVGVQSNTTTRLWTRLKPGR